MQQRRRNLHHRANNHREGQKSSSAEHHQELSTLVLQQFSRHLQILRRTFRFRFQFNINSILHFRIGPINEEIKMGYKSSISNMGFLTSPIHHQLATNFLLRFVFPSLTSHLTLIMNLRRLASCTQKYIYIHTYYL